MATDNSPPRLKLIITIGAITILTLVGLTLVLNGYFAYMSDQARHAKLAPTTALDEHRQAEQAELASGKMSIGQAAAELAKGQREGLIAPQQSEDLGPMTGWSKLPKAAPVPGEAAPTVVADASAEATTDAAVPSDAGVSDAGATDAGAAKKPAAHDAGVVNHH